MNISQEDRLIEEEYNSLLRERQQQSKRNQLTYKNQSIWSDATFKPTKIVSTNTHKFNTYADKLLVHLVIEMKFDFKKISEILCKYLNQILAYSFKEEAIKYTQQICRQRWYQLHRDRDISEEIKEKQMENKRIQSIMSMTDPFLLYNIDEKLHKMQQQQKSQKQSNSLLDQQEYKYEGYNIFKNSIRQIDDIQKYKQLQKQMKQALSKASNQIQLEKPMLYSPYYQRLQEFQVLQQQLTLQKMQKMMSHPIEMQLIQRQLKTLDLNEHGYSSTIKKQNEKKIRQQRIHNEEEFEIEQDWDQYQSD